MGYCHYIHRPQVISESDWAAIVSDTKRVFNYIQNDLGIVLTDGFGGNHPKITANEIWFNGGDQPQGMWTTTEHISAAPWPAEDASMNDPDPDPVGSKTAGIKYGGTVLKQRVAPCDGQLYGSGEFETCGAKRIMLKGYVKPNVDGLIFDCCKTGFRPYDLAVTAFYCIMKHHLPQCIVTTDGTECHWMDAIMICHNVLGYPIESPLNNQ